MLETPINREYVRTENWSVVAKTSKDGDAEPEQWTSVQVPDLAAGGILFLTDITYEKGDSMWFDLQIDPMTPGVYGTIKIKTKGEIKAVRGKREELNAYAVAFLDMTDSDKIRLDELVRLTNFRYKVDGETDIFDR